jgi:hypothetical protein
MSNAQAVSVILTAIAAVLGGWAAVRQIRPKERDIAQQGASTILSKYDALVSRQDEELISVKRQCREDIERLRREHKEEREALKHENKELLERIDELEAKVVALMNGRFGKEY